MTITVNHKPATPLPWETRPVRAGILGDESSMTDAGNDLNAVEPKMYGGTKIIDSGIPKQDAAYIAHAANAYAGLVTKLKLLREEVRDWQEALGGEREGLDELCASTDALLAELGEGT